MDTAIQHSVGRQGRNHRHDVLVVQMLLNNHIFAISPRPKLSIDGVCGARTISAISAYQQREMRLTHLDGIIYPGDRTLRALLAVATVKHRHLVQQVHQIQTMQSSSLGPVANVNDVAPPPKAATAATHAPEAHVAAAKEGGHKYTDSPLELVRTRTLVNPLTLPDLLRNAWPELNQDGARLITAQYMGETTGGKSCWNYNLGNVKCSAAQRTSHLHQYLQGTWEYWAADVVAAYIARDANARYATPAEIRAKVSKETGGKKVIFFEPPDPQCCFRAYKSLGDGVVDWTDRYKRTAKKYPALLGQLNKSDYATFASVLKKEGYYSQNESIYAISIKKQKEYLDRTMKAK